MRTCLNCQSTTTYIDDRKGAPHEHWIRYENGYLCHKCYSKLISNKTKTHKEWFNKRLRFKNERINLKENPRKGICKICNKQGLTHIHHIQYHEDDPLKDTVELCPSCHRKKKIKGFT